MIEPRLTCVVCGRFRRVTFIEGTAMCSSCADQEGMEACEHCGNRMPPHTPACVLCGTDRMDTAA